MNIQTNGEKAGFQSNSTQNPMRFFRDRSCFVEHANTSRKSTWHKQQYSNLTQTQTVYRHLTLPLTTQREYLVHLNGWLLCPLKNHTTNGIISEGGCVVFVRSMNQCYVMSPTHEFQMRTMDATFSDTDLVSGCEPVCTDRGLSCFQTVIVCRSQRCSYS